MKFALLTLHVKDMDKSLAFYHELLEMPIVRRQPPGPGKELVFLGQDGDVNLELIPAEGDTVFSGFSAGFVVEDLAAVKERLAAHGYPVKREFSPNPSLILSFLDGPDGEEIELIKYL